MALNTANSVVDFLKSRGFKSQPSDRIPYFTDRKNFYDQMGLTSSMGEFRGTPSQNLTLLKKLGEVETSNRVSITPDNIYSMLRVNQSQGAGNITAPLPSGTTFASFEKQ